MAGSRKASTDSTTKSNDSMTQQQPQKTANTQQNSQQPVDKTKAVRQELDDVTKIMQSNIATVARRGENLESIESKTQDLAASSKQFAKKAKKVKNKMWWKSKKMILIMTVIISLVILIALLVVGLKISGRL